MNCKAKSILRKSLILKLVITILLITSFTNLSTQAADDPSYLTFTDVDRNTFNEYWYKITRQFFILQENFNINQTIDVGIANDILVMAKTGYNYLPDNLKNENYLYKLSTAVQRWVINPNNEANFTDIVESIWNYLNNTDIQSISWKIEAFPSEWNAPLTVTLKWSVEDPSWSNLSDYNYTWWLDQWGRKVVIWQKPTIKYTFTKEWNITIFLEVKSNHKNAKGFTDVLPFKSSTVVKVNTKIASLVLNVNWKSLKNQEVIKVSPLEASYWLIFDATSSTPTEWTAFEETTWDFWNGIKKTYKWWPKIERITYSNQGDFDVLLQIKTNQWKVVEKAFQIFIHKPIATIYTSSDRWYLGDKFSFSAQTVSKTKELTYSWEIIDIDDDKIIYRKSWKLFNYSFTKKWKFNIKLKIKNASWDTDIDNKIIYIESKPPVADFKTSIPEKSKPNTIFLDWSKSFDPDFSDDWNLKYYWIIDWQRVKLDDTNNSSSTWYFTFDSTWEHSISLEVRDSDGISNIKKWSISIKSVLDVDFTPFPKVTKRWWFIKFSANSPDAKIYEWDFWDWEKEWWNNKIVTHYYKNSGSFEVKLKVRDKNDNSNTTTKMVYVSESDEPFAIINLESISNNWWASTNKSNTILENQCEWDPAYIIDRTMSIKLKWWESINIDWKKDWLNYTWKIGGTKLLSDKDISYKYDDIWCHKVKLTVTNTKKGKSNSSEIWLKVENLKPELKSLNLNIKDINSDPIIITTSAIWAIDRDWIIQSYLWYYYTDTDIEPQWFKSTRTNSTTFVLPKIAWNYYFVLIMKDNNGGKTESKKWENSITLSWDNINTPLISLSVNDSSISAWQEIVFTTKVENILWMDLSNKVKYSWDFDWDGFYDTETTKPEIAYSYNKSWEFYAKVKVKYKGFSNTKTVTINVANQLMPDFKYISIWNKFIFFNKSTWTISNIIWDMWNWDKIRWKNNFAYTYKTKESSHKVKLTISEWNKTKNKEIRVVKNIRNILKSRKPWMNIFSIPELWTWKTVTLKNESENFFLYFWESKWEYKYFPVDYDISYDSDLNWWKDDDEDNKWEESYTSWAPFSVPLNKNREQVVRVTLLNWDLEALESIDIKIVKEYIEIEEVIETWNLSFSGVTDSEKETIEEIKYLITLLPDENKKESLSYIVKLQEEWSDSTEKTRTILDFEEYLDTVQSAQKDTIIDLLESLLVDWQIEKSEKNITFNALKSLLPENISCTDIGEFWSCYEFLLDKLEQISNSNDIEKNKALGTEILEVIARQDKSIIDVKQWFDFKAILKSLMYGSTSEIPVCEEWELNTELCRNLEEQPLWNDNIEDSSSETSSIFKNIFKWILWLLLIGWWLMFVYFIYYKLTNKNSDSWFEDFIMEKTNPDEEKIDDVLWFNEKKDDAENKVELNDNLNADIINEDKNEIKNIDIFSDIWSSDEINKEYDVKENVDKNKDSVPSWLNLDAWKNEKLNQENKIENKNEDIEAEDVKEEINVVNENKAEIKENKDEDIEVVEKKVESKIIDSKNIVEKKQDSINNEAEEEDNTPEWLKWSFTNAEKSKNKINENKNVKKRNENKINENKKDDKTPDWLKNISKEEEKVEEKNNKTPDWLNDFSNEDKKKEEKIEIISEAKKEEKIIDKVSEKMDEEIVEEKKSLKNNTNSWKSINGKSIDVPNWLDTVKNKDEEIVEKIEIEKDVFEEIDLWNEENEKVVKVANEVKVKNEKSIKSKTLEIDLSTDSSDKDVKVEKKTNKKEEIKPSSKESVKKDEKIESDMELWDDGMKVPDWLKTDDNK